jgi:hypothetical protein
MTSIQPFHIFATYYQLAEFSAGLTDSLDLSLRVKHRPAA